MAAVNKRGETPYHKRLRSFGLALKPGTRFSGTLKWWIHAHVVDLVTGEDRGERWMRFYEGKWETTKQEPERKR